MKKPMLAVSAEDLTLLRYPLLASTKMDGIRATIHPEGPRTRSLKEIPNRHVARLLATLPAGLDGELGTVGSNGAIDFRATTGDIRREDGEPTFKFFVFDNYLINHPFLMRVHCLMGLSDDLPDWVEIVEQVTVRNADEVTKLFEQRLAEGHEGLILRDPNGAYKHGRSTLKEHGMLKVKPWEDAEAVCLNVIEEQFNGNEAQTNELGRTFRSAAKAGKTGKGTMGTLVVKSDRWPGEFEIGTGFTAEDRKALWDEKPIGKLIKFKYCTVGGYSVPRHTVFLGVREGFDT